MQAKREPDVGVENPHDQPIKASRYRPKKGTNKDQDAAAKRRCVSSACTACRRRKSKCDGNIPSCAACSSVYGTPCVYDPNSDHRRKGVYRKDVGALKTNTSTLQTLIQGILQYPEDEAIELFREIRACEDLDELAESITKRVLEADDEKGEVYDYEQDDENDDGGLSPRFEKELSTKMGELRLENGKTRFLGGTSNLLYGDVPQGDSDSNIPSNASGTAHYATIQDAFRSWTSVTDDASLITHLINLYLTWHYTYFTTLSKALFVEEFRAGEAATRAKGKSGYCTPLLVNAMLALGCHFTTWPAARANPSDSATAGDHFFREAKRLIAENDEHEHPRLATVQALALMSVREAGCGREAKGWVYSGMSFRMALDLGLNVDSENTNLDEYEVDARRITFWGCFLFDKCWSNYLGRPPQLPLTNTTVAKFEVFPDEDAEPWQAWNDAGQSIIGLQPARTRAIALQLSKLCEISNDLILTFYRPTQLGKPLKKQAEVKLLNEFHNRLDAWQKDLPKEFEPCEGQRPNVLIMHMFYHLLFIHLFRPFLKYTQGNSNLPANVLPRKMCTQAAAMISKLLRTYKRTYGLRQICNIAVYITHSACTIHLLNFPDKDARRDIVFAVKHLEEISEMWLCARRTLAVLSTQVRRWNIVLPAGTVAALTNAEAKYTQNTLSTQANQQESYFSGHYSPTTEHSARVSPPAFQAKRAPMYPQSSIQPMYSPTSGMAGVRQAAMYRENAGFVPPLDQSTSIGTGSPPAVASAGRTPPAGAVSMNSTLSPTTLFGTDNTIDHAKDWWLKDQSSLFDQFVKDDGSASFMTNNMQGSGIQNGMHLQSGIVDGGLDLSSMTGACSADDFGFGNDLSVLDDLSMPYNMEGQAPNTFAEAPPLHNTEYLEFGMGNNGLFASNVANGDRLW